MSEFSLGIPYTVELIGDRYCVLQRSLDEILFLSTLSFATSKAAEAHAEGLNFLRERAVRSSTTGKGLHWPPSPSNLS
jgi:hypothetical protein